MITWQTYMDRCDAAMSRVTPHIGQGPSPHDRNGSRTLQRAVVENGRFSYQSRTIVRTTATGCSAPTPDSVPYSIIIFACTSTPEFGSYSVSGSLQAFRPGTTRHSSLG